MTESRRPRKATWRNLPPSEMAAHLLDTPTISDGTWPSQPRLPGEARSDFVRRVLLGETTKAKPKTTKTEPQNPTAKAVELIGLQRGYYLLNTDGGNAGNRLGCAAIGAVLRVRKRRLITVGQVSMAIGPATHNVAEYRALYRGLRARARPRRPANPSLHGL